MALGEANGSSWQAPEASSSEGGGGLRLNNSLTQSKVRFHVKDGRRVTWYICGPTVYDATHIGHARTYLSFDIIRRILESYFGYQVFYVMNVTDVDDKIIKRARHNHLLQNYLDAKPLPAEVREDVAKAMAGGIQQQEDAVAKAKSSKKAVEEELLELTEPAAHASKSRVLSDLNTKVEQEEAKLRQVVASFQAVNALPPTAQVGDVLQKGADFLAAELDSQHGHSVTDPSIFRAHAAKYEKEFFHCMGRLGVQPPDVLTRVTEYVPAIVEYVEKIKERGFAYCSQPDPQGNCSIYFDTVAFREAGHHYGKLCPHKVGSAALSSESESNFATSEKRSRNDFALWKASKRGEPSWESPWGRGRPGWHIECSAMASEIIGPNIDIHSGGIDLQFPHHDNEMAQAEAFFDCQQWVNYFLHTGHLHIEGLKMSKSLKNFITIDEALTKLKYTPRQIRLLFILQSWDKPMEFGENSMASAASTEKMLRNFFQNVQLAAREAGEEGEERWEDAEKLLMRQLADAQDKVRRRLEDNFDTRGAMDALADVSTAVNKYVLAVAGRRPRVKLLRKCAGFVSSILKVFGVEDDTETAGTAGEGSREEVLAPFLDAFTSFRDDVRKAAREGAPKEHVLKLTDEVRDGAMVDLGVRLEDRSDAPAAWKLDDALALQQEREEKRLKAMADARHKLLHKRTLKVKELEKWEAAAMTPEEIMKAGGRFGSFDEQGVPVLDAAGQPLSGKAQKAAKKEFEKAAEAHRKYLDKLGGEPGFLEALRNEVEGLSEQISSLTQQS